MTHNPPLNAPLERVATIANEAVSAYNCAGQSSGGILNRETEWIKLIAKGDLKAFERLCRTYQQPLFGYLIRMLGDRGAAEEAVNDVLHAIWKGADRYNGDAQPGSWIFGIARHKALDRIRRPNQVTDDIDEQDLTAPQGESSLFLKDTVANALARLSPEQREVIELTFFIGFSYQEIASVADCPVNTVKTRMYHAKQKLKRILARESS